MNTDKSGTGMQTTLDGREVPHDQVVREQAKNAASHATKRALTKDAAPIDNVERRA